VSTAVSPVDWPELLAHRTEHLQKHVAQQRDSLARLAPGNSAALGNVAGAANSILDALPIIGREACLPLVECARAVREREQVDAEASALAPVQLGYANLDVALRALQGPAGTDEREARYLERVYAAKKQLTEQDEFRLAFQALAVGRADIVQGLFGKDKSASFDPNATFEFHTEAFLRQIARAQSESRPASDVEPAWREFVRLFPRKYAAKTLKLRDFAHASRAVLVQLAGITLTDWPAALRDVVHSN
jgi:hypothetical protein